MAERFAGKTVVVTGGNSGIGQATAVAFAKEGARVIVTGRRREALEETERLHPAIVGVVADVQSPSDARLVVEKAVEIGGGIDVLVNNAGVAQFELLADLSIDRSQQMFSINVLGLIGLTQTALASLTQRKGSIVNISSVVGNQPAAGASVYSATKAAVNALTRAWAVELAGTGVRVNAVAPGPVETPIFGKTGMTDEQLQATIARLTATVPIGRIGAPDEIATWVLHLADPSAAWVTGQIIGVDGGKSA